MAHLGFQPRSVRFQIRCSFSCANLLPQQLELVCICSVLVCIFPFSSSSPPPSCHEQQHFDSLPCGCGRPAHLPASVSSSAEAGAAGIPPSERDWEARKSPLREGNICLIGNEKSTCNKLILGGKKGAPQSADYSFYASTAAWVCLTSRKTAHDHCQRVRLLIPRPSTGNGR